MTLTFGSLFAGIGGIDLGLERAGMNCRWQVEIDPFCQKVLAKHWPDVRRYEDVRDCGKHNLEPVDLICGGFPCQPHSVAGKRKGKADDRNLWPEYLRIIAELRPRWILGENVPGIRTTMLDEVLSDLDGLAYTTGTLIVPACAFDAPHRRERVFIVAYAKGIQGWDQQENLRDGTGRRCRSQSGSSNTNTKNVADADRQRLAQRESKRGNTCQKQPPAFRTDWWTVEPDVGRVAHGVPNRIHRLRALGNAVVPQVAEWIGRQILEAHSRP